MQYLIGTDEAGYGPNLGPLVVSATLWEVPEGVGPDDLYDRLAQVVVPSVAQAGDLPEVRVAMADSKALYKPGGGLQHLERGLWAAFGLLDWAPTTWTEAWDCLAPEAAECLQSVPWYADYECPVPIDADAAGLASMCPAVASAVAEAGVRLLAFRSRAVFPAEFNRLVEHHSSKGAALSDVTLTLASALIEQVEGGQVFVVCDKHGGRNRYAPLLFEFFPDALVEVCVEGRGRSVYRLGRAERRVEFRFQAKGESCLPAALASMASKYLRELAMRAVNDFWCPRVKGLRPTAGYPQDAKRFKGAIAATQADLGIEDRVLWRMK